jgi:hypothetical protein
MELTDFATRLVGTAAALDTAMRLHSLACLALTLLGLSGTAALATTHIVEGTARAPSSVRKLASRGANLGVWGFHGHYQQGRREAGLQMNSDFINVAVRSDRGSRRYYVFQDRASGGPALQFTVAVRRRGPIQIKTAPGATFTPGALEGYLGTALGER